MENAESAYWPTLLVDHVAGPAIAFIPRSVAGFTTSELSKACLPSHLNPNLLSLITLSYCHAASGDAPSCKYLSPRMRILLYR